MPLNYDNIGWRELERTAFELPIGFEINHASVRFGSNHAMTSPAAR